MRVLILGGTGFIGSHVVDSFLAAGADVVVVSRTPERFRPPLDGVRYVQAALDDTIALKSILSSRFDIAIHLACSTTPQSSNEAPVSDVQLNLIPSLTFFELCANRGVGKVIFASSGGTVYGTPNQLPVSEEHPTNPICHYGVVKLALEKSLLLLQESSNLPCIILRISNPFGIRQDPVGRQGAVSIFMHRMIHGVPLEVWGDGTIIRDFVHVTDVAKVFVSAANSSATGIFNVGSGEGTSVNGVLKKISGVLNIRPVVRYFPRRDFDVPSVILNASRARKHFGWQPAVGWQEGLVELSEWLRMNYTAAARAVPSIAVAGDDD